MIPDRLLKLADSLALTAVPDPATTRYSDVVNLKTLQDIGTGVQLYCRVQCDENIRCAALGSGGTTFYLAYGDNATLSNPVYQNTAICNYSDTTGLTLGQVFYIPVTPFTGDIVAPGNTTTIPNASKKFFGVIIGGFGSNYTSGKITIDIVTEINRTEHRYYGAGPWRA